MEILLKRIFSKRFTLISELSHFDLWASEWVPYAIPFTLNTQTFYVCSKFSIVKKYSWWQSLFSSKTVMFDKPVRILVKFVFDNEFLNIYIYDTLVENDINEIKRFFSRFLKQDVTIFVCEKELIVNNLSEAEKILDDFEILN